MKKNMKTEKSVGTGKNGKDDKNGIWLSIVIPAYNEESSIEKTVHDLIKTTSKSGMLSMHKQKVELIVVNDASKDKTHEILEELKKMNKIKIPLTVIHHKTNKGYGASLKTGIAHARGEWILITDCDGTYPIETIPQLLSYTNEYDMVVGSRTGDIVETPLIRRPAKWILRKLAELVAGQAIPDLNSGLRVFKKDIALRFWGLFPERFSFTTTITLACMTNGYDVKFVPINYFRRQGKSSIKATDFFNFLVLIIRILTYFRPLHMFIPLSLLMIFVGVVKAGIDFTNQNYFGVGAVLLILVGIQIGLLGLLADLIIKRTTL